MPIYNVRTKRGTLIPVEAPEGTPQNSILQTALRMEAEQNLAQGPVTAAPDPDQGDFMRSLDVYRKQWPGLYGAAKAGIGQQFGWEGMTKSGLEQMQESEKAVSPLSKPTDSIQGAWDEGIFSVVTDFAPYWAGQGVGMLAELGLMYVGGTLVGAAAGNVPGAATGGFAAMITRKAAKAGIMANAKRILKEKGKKEAAEYTKKATANITAKYLASDEGKNVFKKEMRRIGQKYALGSLYAKYGLGEVYQTAIGEATKDIEDPAEQLQAVKDLNSTKLGLVSWAHAYANVLGFRVLKKSLDKLKKPTQRTLLNVAKSVAAAGAEEGPIEVLQSALERFGADLPLADKEAFAEYINALAAGIAMPLVPATIGGLRTPTARPITKGEPTDAIPQTDVTKVTDETTVDEGKLPTQSKAQVDAEILSNAQLDEDLAILKEGLERAEVITPANQERIEAYEAEQARRAADPDLYEDYEPQPLPTSVETPRPETPVVEEAVETTTFVNPEFEGRTQGDIQAELNNAMLARDATDDFGNVEDPTVTDYIEELEQELADRQLVEQDAEIIRQEDAETGPKQTIPADSSMRDIPNEEVQRTIAEYDAQDREDNEALAGTAETLRTAIDEPITKKSLLENGFKKGWPEYKSAPVGLLSDPQNYLYYEKLANKQVNISDIDAVQEQRLNNVIDASNKTLNSVERPTDAIIDYRTDNEPEVSRETIEQQEGEKHDAREQRRSAFNARVSQPYVGTTGEGSAISRKPESDPTTEGTKEFDRARVDGGPPDLPATTGRTGELATPLRGEKLEKEVKALGQRLKNLLANPGLLSQKNIYGTIEYKLISAAKNNHKIFKILKAENPRTLGEALKSLIKNRKITDPATTELVTAFRNAKNIQEVPFTFGPMPQENADAAGYYDPEGKYIVINDEESVWNGSNADSWIEAIIQVSEGDRDMHQLKFNGQPVDFYLSPMGSKNTLNSTQLDALAYLPNTILHEARHALTIESLNEHVNDNLTPKRGSKIGEDAIKIFNAYRQAYPYTYASTNIYDFFAEATSSAIIMVQLNSLPSVIKRQKTLKTLLDDFMFALKRLLGLKTSDTLFADFLALSPHFELGIEAFDVDAAYQKERDLFTRKTIPDKYGSSLSPVNTLQETDPEVVEMLERKELPSTAEALKKTARDKVRRNLDMASGRQQESIREDSVPPAQPQFAATPTRPLEEQIAEAEAELNIAQEIVDASIAEDGLNNVPLVRRRRLAKAKKRLNDLLKQRDKAPGLQFAATPPGPPTEAKVINQAGEIPVGPTTTDEIAEANKKSTQKVNPQNYRELLDLSGQIVKSQPVYSKGLMQGIRDKFSKFTSWAQKYYVQLLSLSQIFELFPDVPGVKALEESVENRASALGVESKKLEIFQLEMSRILDKYRNTPVLEKWTNITYELSRQNIHPGKEKNKDHALVKEFKALPQDLQDIAIGMHKSLMKRSEETLDALEKITGTKVDYLRDQFKKKQLEFYQPFLRDGDYWFDYEIQTEEGPEKVVVAAQTPAERERLKEEAKTKKDFIRFIPGKEAYSRPSPALDSPPDREMYNYIQDLLNKADISPELKETLKDNISQEFLSRFRADSVQAASRHRHGFHGFIKDLEYGFANASHRSIKNINDLTYLPDIKAALNKIKDDVGPDGTPRGYRKGIYEAINNRASFYLNPTAQSWASAASFTSYAWYIGGNISSAFVNLTQMPIVVAPMLGLDYGIGKSISAIENARKLYFQGDIEGKAKLRNKSTWETRHIPDYTMEEGFNAEQKQKYGALFKTANQRMTLTRGLIHESIDFNSDTKLGRSANLVNQALGWTFKNSERANRELTLVAAFDLAREAGDSEQIAIEKAIKLTVKAHSHALPEAGPLLFQQGIGKVAFTFKRFAQAQIYLVSQLLGRSFNLAYHLSGDTKRKLNKKEMNIARKQLMGISGMAYMFAGVQGLPFYGAADALASLIIDDDEDPFLLDDFVKQSIGEVGYKGPLSAAFNIDVASRTGFRDLFWRADRRRREEVGEAVYIAEHFGGPSWSILTGIDRGAKDINNGNIIRGLEQMTPSWIRNQIKTFRFATEGATTRKGLKIVDDPNAYNLFMQAFGFSSTDLSRAYERVSIMKYKEGKTEGLRSRLLLTYYLATVAGDGKGINKIQKRINSFNMKNPEVAISGKTLTSSRKTFDRKAQEAVYGVTLNPKLRDRLMEETDYDDDDAWFYND